MHAVCSAEEHLSHLTRLRPHSGTSICGQLMCNSGLTIRVSKAAKCLQHSDFPRIGWSYVARMSHGVERAARGGPMEKYSQPAGGTRGDAKSDFRRSRVRARDTPYMETGVPSCPPDGNMADFCGFWGMASVCVSGVACPIGRHSAGLVDGRMGPTSSSWTRPTRASGPRASPELGAPSAPCARRANFCLTLPIRLRKSA